MTTRISRWLRGHRAAAAADGVEGAAAAVEEAVQNVEQTARELEQRVEDAVGGRARTVVVLLFACVLALESADLATVGALGPQLQSHLHVSDTQLGLLAAASTFVAGVMTIPFGVLTDRVRRVDLLTGAVASWSVAMLVGAGAQGYTWLLLSRLGLGAVAAAASPAIASMLGDFFAPHERGKIYGYVLSGELLGAGFGFVVSGSLGSALSWRWGLAVLAIPAILLALALRRWLVEPARGGQRRLGLGAQSVAEAALDGPPPTGRPPEAVEGEDPDGERDETRAAIIRHGARADGEQVLNGGETERSLPRVIRYVLSIPTNRWLIIASAIGYFFFAGMRTFAVVFVRGHYGLSQGSAIAVLFVAGLGSLVAVLISGRVADARIRRGHVTARIVLGAVLYMAAAAFLLPAILLTSLAVAVPFLVIGAACLSAPNPPLDAARLDIMPSRLWGRAEGVRSLLRETSQAAAPLLFGVLADVLGGVHGTALGSGSSQKVSAATSRGLMYAFAIMLIPLALNGILLMFVPRRSYATDVATAMKSDERSDAAAAARSRAPLARDRRMHV